MRVYFPLTQKLKGITSLLAVAVSFSSCAVKFKNRQFLEAEISPGFTGALTVEALYPANGAGWNDYVKNNGSDLYHSSGAACDGTEAGVLGCVHGGEKKKVTLTGVSSCTGLTLTDQLGVFDWICDATSGTAIFYSVGLKETKGLKDLVDATAFKENKVTLTGSRTGESELATWWTNPVVALPDNAAAAAVRLDGIDDGGNDDAYAAGTIFTLAASTTTGGYNLNADRLSLVTFSGAVLTYSGSAANNCHGATAENNGSNNYRCLISAGAQKFLWIEGEFDGEGGANDTGYNLMLGGVTHSRIHQVKMRGGENGFGSRAGMSHNLITQLSISGSQWGIELGWDAAPQSERNVFIKTSVSNILNQALDIFQYSGRNVFSDLAISNTAGVGAIQLDNTDSNAFSRVVVSGTSASAFLVKPTSAHNAISFVTMTNGLNGIVYSGPNINRNTFHHVVGANNGTAVEMGGSGATTGTTFSQLVATNNGTYGVRLANDANTNRFAGNLLVGNNGTNCSVTATGTNKGLVNTTCTSTGTDGTSDYPVGSLSSAVLRLSRTLASTFVGKVTTGDATNASDTNGTANFSSAGTFDWTRFSNFFRLWGEDGSAFPNADHRGQWTAGTGRIWDWSLASSDTVITNNSRNGASANEAFINGAACPMAVHGDVATTDQMSTPNTYLLNAMEILLDNLGDDDGLCESDEACIYAPNFGAFQGTGSYTSNTCLFQDDGDAAAVDDVTMYAYDSVVVSDHDLDENFNDGAYSADFVTAYGSGLDQILNGEWEVSPPANTNPLPDFSNTFEALQTAAALDFTGKEAVTEVTQMSGAGTQAALGVQIDAQNGYSLHITGGNLHCDEGLSGVWENNVCAAYDSAAHRFLRIRHDTGSGTMNWEVSADGVSWTNLRSTAPNASLPIATVRVGITAGAYANTATPGTAKFEQIYVK